jgi:deuterolysin
MLHSFKTENVTLE